MCDRSESKHYDLQILKRSRTIMDRIVDNVRVQKADKIKFYYRPSRAFENFNLVTLSLVAAFEKDARFHVRHLLDNGSRYRTLYWLTDSVQMFNTVEINYADFMLLDDREKELEKVESIAKCFFPKRCVKFDITCLYLLYFYALLVNRRTTWVTLDYLNYGNKFHQYFTEYAREQP